MQDILRENVMTIQEACDRLPRRRAGRRTHPSTVIRWIQHGLGGVKLAAVKIGGTWLVSEESIRRFLLAVARTKNELATLPTNDAVDSRLRAEGLIELNVENAARLSPGEKQKTQSSPNSSPSRRTTSCGLTTRGSFRRRDGQVGGAFGE